MVEPPNAQHQRPEPATAEQRKLTEQNGWLRSAACCGSASWQDATLTAVRALRGLFDSAQCVSAPLRAAGLSPQVRTEIRPGWDVVCALAVLSRPDAFDSGEHSQLTDADARRFGTEGPRQAHLTIAWLLEVSLRDEAALADEDFDALPNCLVTLVVIQLATPLSARSIDNDPGNLSPIRLSDSQNRVVYAGAAHVVAEHPCSLAPRQ